jgi:hypothetical protein
VPGTQNKEKQGKTRNNKKLKETIKSWRRLEKAGERNRIEEKKKRKAGTEEKRKPPREKKSCSISLKAGKIASKIKLNLF